jgi:hypothetical protein
MNVNNPLLPDSISAIAFLIELAKRRTEEDGNKNQILEDLKLAKKMLDKIRED